jgi:hypothetical protein
LKQGISFLIELILFHFLALHTQLNKVKSRTFLKFFHQIADTPLICIVNFTTELKRSSWAVLYHKKDYSGQRQQHDSQHLILNEFNNEKPSLCQRLVTESFSAALSKCW